MIETAKQTKEALDEIKRLTQWTNARMADKIGVFRGTLDRIYSGHIKNPSVDTMAKIEKELIRVRRIHK